MSEANAVNESTNWTNPTVEQTANEWKEAIAINMALKQFVNNLADRVLEQEKLLNNWKTEVEKLTLDNHILREELERERAPKQDIR